MKLYYDFTAFAMSCLYVYNKNTAEITVRATVHTVAIMALEASPSEQSNNEMFQ